MEQNDKLKQHQSLAIQLRQVVPSIQQLYHEQAAFLSTLNVQNVLSVDVKQQRIQILNHCFASTLKTFCTLSVERKANCS